MEKSNNKLKVLLIYAALALTTFIAYERVRNCDFVYYDDSLYVFENHNVIGGLTFNGVKWAFNVGYASNWHPLTWLSHMLDCELFGLNPLGHHLMNLFFHIVNTLLLFFVLKRMTSAVWRSFFVAAAFALHPLHVESVAWIAERKDVLSGFFWMLTMWAYVRYTERPGIYRYLLTLLSFALGLMAKPMLVTLPFVLLLLDYWPLGRLQLGRQQKSKALAKSKLRRGGYQGIQVWRLVREKIPLLVLSAASSVVTYIAQQIGDSMTPAEQLPLKFRIINVANSYVTYIVKMFYPTRLAVLYPYSSTLSISTVALLLIGILVLLYRWARGRPWLTVGLLWYLGTLVPVIGLVQVGSQSMADRYTYMPSIGIFIIVAWGAAELGARCRLRKIWLGIFAGILFSLLLVCTRVQLRYWRNSSALFEHALAVTEDNSVMHERYATAMLEEGNLDEAIKHYKESLRLEPTDAVAYNNLGIVLAEQGKIDEAIKYYEKALQIDPDNYKACSNIGMAKVKQKKYDQAIKYLEAALERKPDWPEVCFLLGEAYFELGNLDRAVSYWYRVLESNPDNIKTLNNLAWVKATFRQNDCYDPKEAAQLAKRACELTGHNQPALLDTLAAAYAAAGNFPEAVKIAEEAVKLAEAAGETDLTKEIQGRIILYKSERPYHQR